MELAIIQTNPAFSEVQRNVDEALRSMERLEADLYVLPELFNTGYNFISKDELLSLAEPAAEGWTFERMAEFSQQRSCHVVYGFAEKDDGKVYNASALVGRGRLIGVYRKIHLYFREKLFFDEGDLGFRVFDTPLGRIGIMICFDWYFPESARSLALQGAELIAHPANLVLPYCQDAMVTRCLENRVFAATANRVGEEDRGGVKLRFTGRSEVVTPEGELLVRLSASKPEEGVVTVDAQTAKNKRLNALNDLFSDRRVNSYTA